MLGDIFSIWKELECWGEIPVRRTVRTTVCVVCPRGKEDTEDVPDETEIVHKGKIDLFVKEKKTAGPAKQEEPAVKEPVFGIFHECDFIGAVPLDINGHKVYVDVKDLKGLYARMGPALKKYKKEHAEE